MENTQRIHIQAFLEQINMNLRRSHAQLQQAREQILCELARLEARARVTIPEYTDCRGTEAMEFPTDRSVPDDSQPSTD